jgi:hypothetical protein
MELVKDIKYCMSNPKIGDKIAMYNQEKDMIEIGKIAWFDEDRVQIES